ncbi:MAG TPA: J domain-containing protein [Nitriliruptoraceae bacterium]|nr:J domain-containing protein [Nitriliruptoraceae bacterium]
MPPRLRHRASPGWHWPGCPAIFARSTSSANWTSLTMSDLYDLLDVPRDASTDQIKKAYRRAARSAHPDAGGNEDAFKQVQHAYRVLSDPQARTRYDRFGDDGTPGSRAQDPFGFGGGGLGDVIDAFFGQAFGDQAQGGGGRRRTQRGRDVLVPVELTLEDLLASTEETVEVDVAATCESCGGTGSATRAAPSTCGTCKGRGQVQKVVRTAFGQLATAAACPTCDGSGTTVADPCAVCDGEGRARASRSVTVTIPAGVEHGDRIRVRGEGEAARGNGTPGDLYVEVRVAEHDIFDRSGRDLLGELAVPFSQAALGAHVTLPTLDGDAELDIPPGTQPGAVLAVRRRGMPAKGGGPRGDIRLTVRVEVPSNLTPRQHELLEEFAQERGEDAPGASNLFGRLRRAFQ